MDVIGLSPDRCVFIYSADKIYVIPRFCLTFSMRKRQYVREVSDDLNLPLGEVISGLLLDELTSYIQFRIKSEFIGFAHLLPIGYEL